jgi:hypothetical protein
MLFMPQHQTDHWGVTIGMLTNAIDFGGRFGRIGQYRNGGANGDDCCF